MTKINYNSKVSLKIKFPAESLGATVTRREQKSP